MHMKLQTLTTSYYLANSNTMAIASSYLSNSFAEANLLMWLLLHKAGIALI